MEEEQDDDVHERPTVPGDPPDALRFETPVQAFFSDPPAANTAAALIMRDDDEEFAAWWAWQRRRAYASWVAGLMAFCVAVLVAGAMR